MSPAPLVPGHCHPLTRISMIARIITRACFKIQFPGPRKEHEEESTCYGILNLLKFQIIADLIAIAQWAAGRERF